MQLRAYQIAEILGILLVLGATAVQIFYIEPLQRKMEWRHNVFTQQQNGQFVARAVAENRIVLLKALKAPDEDISAAEAALATIKDRYLTADANVANMIIDQEPIEQILQWIAAALFALGTLLTTFGRIAEMRALNRAH